MKTFTKAVWIGSLVAGGLAVAATTALASPDERGECPRGGHSMMDHRGDGEGRFLEHMSRRLDLTKDQQASIEAILKKSEAQRHETRDKLLASREALRKATDAGQVDDKQLQKLAQEQGKLVAEQIVQRARIRAEIDKVLTEAQRGQLKDLRERHEHRFRG